MPASEAERARTSARPVSPLERSRFTFRTGEGDEATRLAAVAAGRALDVAALASRVALGSPLARGATIYQGVRALAPEPEPLGGVEPPPRVGDAAAFLRYALEAAVDRALEGAERVAVLTGGGLDSGALLALAHARGRLRGISVFAVALDFGGPGDDRPHLAALERHVGVEVERMTPEHGAAHAESFLRGVDAAPFTWPGGPMEVAALARAKARGAERVLTGVGADELFDGEPRALAARALGGDPIGAVRAARALRGFERPRAPALTWIARPVASAILPRAVRAWRARGEAWAPPWAGPELVAYLRAAAEGARTRALAPRDTPAARLEALCGAPHREHLAWLRHQQEIAAGVERRDPFLDRALARAVTSLPPAWLLLGQVRRGLFREAIRGLVPESLREREDKASFEPAFTRFASALGGFEALRPLARVPRLAALGLAWPGPFGEAFEELARAPLDSEGWATVWPALAVEAFLRARDEGAAS